MVIFTLRSPQILTPDRIPVAAGKKMANILKKYPSLPRKEGSKLSTKISAARRKLVRFGCSTNQPTSQSLIKFQVWISTNKCAWQSYMVNAWRHAWIIYVVLTLYVDVPSFKNKRLSSTIYLSCCSTSNYIILEGHIRSESCLLTTVAEKSCSLLFLSGGNDRPNKIIY